ncbi:MAG: hypothetical protein ACHQF0_13520 [Chitinophagales bacterium]
MMYPFIRKATTIALFSCIVSFSMAQDPGLTSKSTQTKTESKPFKILTNGRRITIQSNEDINRIMAWTATGHRVVEQTSFDAPSYSFTVPSTEKFLFVLIQLKSGKYFTEKIGVQ